MGGLTDHLLPVEFGSTGERLSAVLRAVTPPATSLGRRLIERARRMPAAGRFQKPYCAAVGSGGNAGGTDRPAPSVSGLFSELTERWEGHGVLERSVGEVIQARAGKALDPSIVRQFDRRVGHRSVSKFMIMFTACYAEPVPGGTNASVVFEPERLPGGLFGLTVPFVARTVRRNYRVDLTRLKQILEHEQRHGDQE